MRIKREAFAAAAAAASVLVAAAGCSKQPRHTTAADVDPIEAERAAAPGMFDAIPLDTPYLFASAEPMAAEVWSLYSEMFASMEGLFAALEDEADDELLADERFMLELVQAVTENPTREGFAALGFDPDPRFAIYGLGAVPVIRMEIGEADAVRALVAEAAASAGFEPPTREIAGHEVWAIPGPRTGFVALLGDELVAVFGPDAALEAAMETLLGRRELGATYSEDQLRSLAEAENLSPMGVGYLDTRRLASLLLSSGEGLGFELTEHLLGGDRAAPEACVAAVDAALSHVPRISLGYTELSRERMGMAGTVHLSEELVPMVAAAQTSVPGLTGSFADAPLFAIGAAVDPQAGARVLARVAGELRSVGEACEQVELQRAAAELSSNAGASIPAPFSSIQGGLVVLNSLDLAGMSAEGYLIAGIRRPSTLLRLVRPFVPQLAGLEIATDGVFRPLPQGLTGLVPFELGLTYAVGDHGVAVAAGETGRAHAGAALATRPQTSPLLALAYDYEAFVELLLAAMPAGDASAEDRAAREMLQGFAGMMGLMTMTVAPVEAGLRLDSVLELELPAGE